MQKSLVGISKNIIDYVIYELTGYFRMIIRDKNGNYFCSNLIKICEQKSKNKNPQIIKHYYK